MMNTQAQRNIQKILKISNEIDEDNQDFYVDRDSETTGKFKK